MPALTATGASVFDPLVVHPARLHILVQLRDLAVDDAAGTSFVRIRRQTGLTDGNLASHARRLANGGLIRIDKSFQQGKPLTTLSLSPAGHAALSRHVSALTSAVTAISEDVAPTAATPLPHVEPAESVSSMDDDWID